MRKQIITLTLILASLWATAQKVGFNCQYIPGLQLGIVKVSSKDLPKNNYSYRVGMPTMMIDRVTNKWYVNMDLSSIFYILSANNKSRAKDADETLARTDGGLCSFRLGRMFGEKKKLGGTNAMRVGFSVNMGYNQTNIDSIRLNNVGKTYAYGSYGLGLVVYKQLDGIYTMGKIGYDAIGQKDVKGKNIYIETTFGIKMYQKFGLSVMPCMYFRTFNNFTSTDSGSSTATNSTIKSKLFTIKFGLTKFF